MRRAGIPKTEWGAARTPASRLGLERRLQLDEHKTLVGLSWLIRNLRGKLGGMSDGDTAIEGEGRA